MTPFTELNEVLAAFLTAVRAELAGNFVGMYLQGSFAVGDPDEHSDCDWIVVTAEPVASAEGLQRMHERIFSLPSPWAQHLEGSYLPREQLRARIAGAEPLLYLDNGSRVLERSGHDDTQVVRWSLREHGVVLAGPEPSSLIDPVTGDQLRQEVRGFMLDWSRSLVNRPEQMSPLWYQRFAVITHCRFLHTLESGRISSKKAAAGWAKAKLDARWQALIERCMAGRNEVYEDPHRPADPHELEETLAFVRFVLSLERCGS